jgi:hypothetical protein
MYPIAWYAPGVNTDIYFSRIGADMFVIKTSRERAVAALRPLANKVHHPSLLDPTDAEAIHAYEIVDEWHREAEQQLLGLGLDDPRIAELNFLRTTLEVDAGFHHPDYLHEVIHNWLPLDLADAEAMSWQGLVDQIQTKISDLQKLLA